MENLNTKEMVEKIQNKKKILIRVGICAAVLCVLLVIFSIVFALININNSNILKGVYINDIDMSEMSQEEAKEKIEALVNEKLAKEMNLTYEDYNSTINATVLELNYDTNTAIEKAYSIGRDGNLITNNYAILKSMLFKNYINIDITLNEEIVKTTIGDMEANLPNALVQSSYYIEEKDLIITKGKRGTVIDDEAFINNIKDSYSDLVSTSTDIDFPVIEVDPDAIDVDKIHEEVYKEAKDAYYNEDPFELYPEVEGVDFNVEEAKDLLQQEDKEEYVIKLIITKPDVTINDLSEIAFKDVLATFSTRYDASNTGRTTNLKLAAGKINGTVLAAGQEFSYNKIVGERTIAAGYKEAKIYASGEVVDGLGGGICQISSTLYNAAVLSNLEITQRRNHQFVTSYLPAGRDATVVYGSQDFKFKNSRKYPIKIEMTVANGMAKATIYGIKENPEYDISIQTSTVSTIPFTTTYKDDPTMEAGAEKVQQKGANGIVTQTYKIVKQNGTVISKTLLSKDVYNAMQKIIVRGPAAPEAPATPEPTPTTPAAPTTPTTPSTPSTTPEPPTNTTTPGTSSEGAETGGTQTNP